MRMAPRSVDILRSARWVSSASLSCGSASTPGAGFACFRRRGVLRAGGGARAPRGGLAGTQRRTADLRDAPDASDELPVIHVAPVWKSTSGTPRPAKTSSLSSHIEVGLKI